VTLVVPVEPPEVFEGYVLDDAFGNSRVYFPLLVAHAELFDEFRVDQFQGPDGYSGSARNAESCDPWIIYGDDAVKVGLQHQASSFFKYDGALVLADGLRD